MDPCDLLQDTSQPLYKIPVFLSQSTPYTSLQKEFIGRIIQEMKHNLLLPRTLGPSDQFSETPLTSIRRMILSSYGCLAVAFQKVYVPQAVIKQGSSDPDQPQQIVANFFLSSPYLQIEPSMAYQRGLPLLLLYQETISQDHAFGGVFEPGATPYNLIRFSVKNIQSIEAFFQGSYWREAFADWNGQVRGGYEIQTEPEFKYSRGRLELRRDDEEH